MNDLFELVVGAGPVGHVHELPAAPPRRASPFDRYTMAAALAAAIAMLVVLSSSQRRLWVARRLVANPSRPPATPPALR